MRTAHDNVQAAVELYLELLKKSLTNTLYSQEPNADDESELQYVNDFIEHYINGAAISMLPITRFDNIQACVKNVIEANVPGDLIETGVWRGGSTIFMRMMLKALEVKDRTVWVADSFEGLPEPNAEKFPVEAKTHKGPVMTKAYRHFAVSIDDVKRNFRAYGALDDHVKFLQGWFKDTLPSAPIENLSILRLDGDYYESTWDALSALYRKVSVGGYIIIDDYGEDSWTYCRKAVDDFRRENNIQETLVQVDSKCFFWRREK